MSEKAAFVKQNRPFVKNRLQGGGLTLDIARYNNSHKGIKSFQYDHHEKNYQGCY
jgi:hypothetical protein